MQIQSFVAGTPQPNAGEAGLATSVAPVDEPRVAASADPYRLSAVLAVLGTGLLLVGTWLHPSHADPAVAASAFAEYAAAGRGLWVAAHLMQLAGIACAILAIILLSRAIAGGSRTLWPRVTATCGAAALAIAATLQAVDAVALKAMVDLWSRAAPEGRATLFAAALAVRQIETGLDALLALLLAATLPGFGVVLVAASAGTRSLRILAFAASGAAALNGIVLALGGFSATAMLATTASGLLAVVLLLTTAGWSWRRARTDRLKGQRRKDTQPSPTCTEGDQ